MAWHGRIANEAERRGTFAPTGGYMAGRPIGIIAVQLDYPKIPGNVQNHGTFPYPVIYAPVSFEIEQLFAGDPSIREMIVQAARDLEAQGAAAIVGACGFFAHFQRDVASAVDVPVFMSSLTQLSTIKLGLKPEQKVLVIAADGASVTSELLANVGSDLERVIVQNVGDRPAFQPIRHSILPLDNGALIDDLSALSSELCQEHPEIGAILLECSDLPPYAADIQAATGRPVYDFITLINWVHQAVVQQPYYGWL